MITRLRPAYPVSRLAELYATLHSASHLVDHQFRIQATVEMGQRWLELGEISSVADLSCGDASIVRALDVEQKILGDFAPAAGHQFTGPLEFTLDHMPEVDLYVCTETLEHLDQPLLALEKMRERSRFLLLSTPVDAWEDDNPEHYWAWDRQGVENLLEEAGWHPGDYTTSDHRASGYLYCFGIWMCS